MSYNRMEDSFDEFKLPIKNGEKYPPIPLPPPPPSTEGVQDQVELQTGQIIIYVTPGVATENDPSPKAFGFNDRSIRNGFIRKVYSILLLQILCTFGIVSVFMFHEPTKLFTQNNPIVLAVAFVLYIIAILPIVCCESARRTVPINFVCLSLVTVTMSFLLGAACSKLDGKLVLLALGITAIMVISLSIFAMQTKYDFTACGGVLLICLVLLTVFGMVAVLWQNMIEYTAYSCIGALLASIYLIYDTQLIIGGNHRYEFSPEEYIFAALTLYLDIIRIFLYVLRLLARR